MITEDLHASPTVGCRSGLATTPGAVELRRQLPGFGGVFSGLSDVRGADTRQHLFGDWLHCCRVCGELMREAAADADGTHRLPRERGLPLPVAGEGENVALICSDPALSDTKVSGGASTLTVAAVAGGGGGVTVRGRHGPTDTSEN